MFVMIVNVPQGSEKSPPEKTSFCEVLQGGI